MLIILEFSKETDSNYLFFEVVRCFVVNIIRSYEILKDIEHIFFRNDIPDNFILQKTYIK